MDLPKPADLEYSQEVGRNCITDAGSRSGRWRRFLCGGGSLRPRPAIACCTHAGRDTSRTAPGSHPPPPPHCVRKDPRTYPPAPYPRGSGNPRLLLPGGVISCECVRLTPAPSAVLPPHRSRLPEGKILLGLPFLYHS